MSRTQPTDQLPNNEADLAALSVTRTDGLTSDEGPEYPVKPKRKARVPRRVRRLVGTPTVADLEKVIANGTEKYGPDPQTIVAARIMFLNGSKPKQICAALRLRPAWLNPYWATWIAEKREYQEKVQSDAWTIGRNMLEKALVNIIEQDLGIGSKLREVLAKTLQQIMEGLEKQVDGKQAVDSKALEQLAKVFKQTSDVTHRMVGLTAKQERPRGPQTPAGAWSVNPVAPLGVIDVPSKSVP